MCWRKMSPDKLFDFISTQLNMHFFFFLALLCCLQYLSSLTSDQTWAYGSESTES